MRHLALLFTLAMFSSAALAVPIVIENTADRFELTFDHDDAFFGFPVGAIGGRSVDIFSGGESASIAIGVSFRDSGGGLEDHIFVFESLTTDIFFPGPVNPGDVLFYSNGNGFAGAGLTGDGLMPGFDITELTIIAGPNRDDAFDARLVLRNVPLPATVWLFGAALIGLGWTRRFGLDTAPRLILAGTRLPRKRQAKRTRQEGAADGMIPRSVTRETLHAQIRDRARHPRNWLR